PELTLELLPSHAPHFEEDLAEPLPRVRALLLERTLQLPLRQFPRSQELLSQAPGRAPPRRGPDRAVLEPGLGLGGPLPAADRQDARLPRQLEELEDVLDPELPELPFDRHALRPAAGGADLLESTPRFLV